MAKDDALKRLGGGRWETKDGRFQIEPQSGTWVIVDTTQTNEFGLPLVRGPFPSLTAAKEAIEDAREEGPVESPLAGRIREAAAPSKAAKPTEATKAHPKPSRRPNPSSRRAEPTSATRAQVDPRPPTWRPAQGDRAHRAARGAWHRHEEAEAVARTEIAQGLPGVARLAIERHGSAPRRPGRRIADAAVAATVEALHHRRGLRTSASRGASSTIVAARSRSSIRIEAPNTRKTGRRGDRSSPTSSISPAANGEPSYLADFSSVRRQRVQTSDLVAVPLRR